MIAVQAIAQALAERMLNSVAEGLAIAVFAWILLRVLRRQNSNTRFMVWFLTLVAIAALPLFNLPGSGASGFRAPAQFMMPAHWALYFAAGWALVAGVGLIRVGCGLWQLQRLRRSCLPLDLTTRPGLTRRGTKICRSDQVTVPTALGFFHPLIVLPSWAREELSPSELHSILLHELAHLNRLDDWTNLGQKIIQALFFFHPAVWCIAQQLTLEREIASDELVLAQTSDPQAYAECLVSVAEKSFLHRGLALAQAAVGRMRQTSQRVAQILNQNRPPATRVFKPVLLLPAAFFCLCLLGMKHRPLLVGFANPSVAPQLTDAERLPAIVIPTAFHVDTANLPGATFSKRAGKAEHKPRPRSRRGGDVVERGQPLLARAQMRDEVQPPGAWLLLVVERARCDDRTAPIWRLTIWHVLVVSPIAERTNAARL